MFYTYQWLREDGTPYYVGKGKGDRGFKSKGHRHRCPPTNRIVINYWPDEETAYAYEMYLINFYGRKDLGAGCLRNLTDGGDKPPSKRGFKHAYEARRRVSESLIRQYASGERSRDGGMLGKHHSEESKNKTRLSNTGSKSSEEAKKKMSLAKLGKKVVNYPKSRKIISEESRVKLRISQQARRVREHTWQHTFVATAG